MELVYSGQKMQEINPITPTRGGGFNCPPQKDFRYGKIRSIKISLKMHIIALGYMKNYYRCVMKTWGSQTPPPLQ